MLSVLGDAPNGQPLHKKTTNLKEETKKMKKKLSLLLAAAMVVGMMPISAFAKSDNSISKVVTVKSDGDIGAITAGGSYTGPELVMNEEDGSEWDESDGETFQLTLDNAKWAEDVRNTKGEGQMVGYAPGNSSGVVATYQVLDDNTILVTVKGTPNDDTLKVPLYSEADGTGDVTVTIDPRNSTMSGETRVFASASGGATKTAIGSVTDTADQDVIKNITVTEVTPGTIKGAGDRIKLRLSGEFEFVQNMTNSKGDPIQLKCVAGTHKGLTLTPVSDTFDDDTIEFELPAGWDASKSSNGGADQYMISGIEIKTTDDAEEGDKAEITISGAGLTKETLTVAQYLDYGYTLKAADKDLPVIYSGRIADNTDVLEVTFKETANNSIVNNRKLTFTFPEEVKVKSVELSDVKNLGSDKKTNNWATTNFEYDGAEVDKNKVTFTNVYSADNKKLEAKMKFEVSVDAGYQGDVTVTAGGTATGNTEISATIAKAELPVKITSEKNEVKIDYRQVPIGDITITEAYPGALEKESWVDLKAEDMQFEDGIEYEVLSGDLKVDKIDVSSKTGTIGMKIKSESAKEAGVVKLSNIKLYLERNLPTGDYKLSLVPHDLSSSILEKTDENKSTEGVFKNYVKDEDDGAPKKLGFDTDEVIVIPDFIKVITAGRDQDDSTFTTKVSVTIGSSEMKVGEKTIPLEVPAYISASGYTMLPVRAVTETLSDRAIVNWDNDTRTITIIFGSRIISMTVGSSNMTINGTSVAMSARVEITNERSFIPLRDLGIALGLNPDTQISWDDATKTATLN